MALTAASPHPPLPRKRGRAREGAEHGRTTKRASTKPGEDGGGETCCGGAVFLVAAGAGYFVHGTEREAAARQGAIERGDAEGQHAMPDGLLDMPDLVTQR